MAKKLKKVKKASRLGQLEKAVQGIERDLQTVVSSVHEIFDEMNADEKKQDAAALGIRYLDPPVYVTANQAKSMSDGDCWIMAVDDKGWLLIGNGDVPADDEGNGVWHDDHGRRDRDVGPLVMGKEFGGTD